MTCDYCSEQAIVKVQFFNHYWQVCFAHLEQNHDRFGVSKESLQSYKEGVGVRK